MAKAPVMASIESVPVKYAEAGRNAAAAKRAGRAGRSDHPDRVKTDATSNTFASVLKRARENGRPGDAGGTAIRKSAAKALKARIAENLSEIIRTKTASVRAPVKESTDDSASPALVENGTAVDKGAARKAGTKAGEFREGNAPVESPTGEEMAENARFAGAAAVEVGTRSKERPGTKRTEDVREAVSGAKAAETGVIADARRSANRAPRVIVEDKRASGETREDRPGRARIKGDGQAARTEPVTFRLEGSGSEAGENRFAVAETDIEISPGGAGRASSRNAAAELSRRLDAQAGSEIVRQVRVVLNRADAGEVRINLRPENLGRVRVRIRMEENRLTGRIFVESAAAREAFRNSLDSLQAKLVESGFGAADLELAWDEGNADLPQFGNPSGRRSKNAGAASREFEGMSSSTEQEGVRIGDGRVDMVV